jgi:hypothetical protein
MIYLNIYDLLDYISYQLEWILCDDTIDKYFNYFIIVFNNRNVRQ